MPKETKENLKEFDLVIPAKNLLDAVTFQADALKKAPMTDERLKNMKLTLGYLNAYIKAFQTKTTYFKLTHVPEKIKTVKKHFKKI